MHIYNTTCKPPILRGYGKNIQHLVDYILTLKDKEQRKAHAHALLSIMQGINPGLKQKDDSTRKFWDDIFIMSNYQLDVDAPYPMPDKVELAKRPMRMLYKKGTLISQYYGRNISNLIQQVAGMTDSTKQEAVLLAIVKLMWNFHRNNAEVDIIFEHIKKIAGKKLDFDFTSIKEKIQKCTPKKKNSFGKRTHRFHRRKVNKNFNSNHYKSTTNPLSQGGGKKS